MAYEITHHTETSITEWVKTSSFSWPVITGAILVGGTVGFFLEHIITNLPITITFVCL
jgi:hypothetical protein